MPNPYGDVELDARGIRALAHPVRLRILNRLQQDGPATATRLSPLVGATPSVTSWHLRHLAEHGLVRDAAAQGSGRERWWEAVSRGFRFERADDEDEQAARALQRVMEEVEGDVPGTWSAETEPLLEPVWRRLSGRSSTRVLLTPAELGALEERIEELLAPYVARKDEDPGTHPAEVRHVRLLRYTLPEAPD